MHIYLSSLGCRLNEAELESWARQFRAGGHRVVSSPRDAQVMVLNSCAVTAEAARKSRQFINRLHRQNPRAHLVVTGCYAELEPARVAALTGVDLVIGNRDKERLVELVESQIEPATMPRLAAEPEATHMYAAARTRAFVKVQDGCRNRCAFCIVTIARGDERSRPLREVVDEINQLVAEGYREVVLTGVHLGGYGRDLGTDLYTLVQTVLRDTDIHRLRLSSLEPWDLPPHFWELWQDTRLMPHLHLPLQSGCDSTLRRMARRCDTASYVALVEAARAAIPDLTLTTDLIVGFPGETEAEWAATVEFVQRIGFGHMHIFTYSPRQGTAAARMKGQVDAKVKRERSRQMHAIAARMKAEHLRRFQHDVREVLWEGPGEPLSDGRVRWSGYTDNYLRVYALGPAGESWENQITPVRLLLPPDPHPDHLMAENLSPAAVPIPSPAAF
ncbi:MAG: tRNA (N(6)-L-threonylcarbamoyladenosine(37)-C(2))-methylthiotransferase MtaB [Caldilineae bacterium]|nr:MAG: tRNA (N(6)-L-threonylcarbamoyladenosine(37)-C(2))-methylthiotransferase MtaB [Caldilineae bacterium]